MFFFNVTFFMSSSKRPRSFAFSISYVYNPHKNNIGNHYNALSDFSNSHSSAYKKVLILGDFSNVYVDDQNMKTFWSYNLISPTKQPTSYENPSRPKCINLILTNVSRNFQTTYVIETGLSDFNSMTLTVTAIGLFQKFLLNTIAYMY